MLSVSEILYAAPLQFKQSLKHKRYSTFSNLVETDVLSDVIIVGVTDFLKQLHLFSFVFTKRHV